LRDRNILYAAAFLRSLAMVGVLIGLYLAKRGLESAEIGLAMPAGLAGAALAALLVTLVGDKVGRRKAQVALALRSGRNLKMLLLRFWK
jgi:MFS family permease